MEPRKLTAAEAHYESEPGDIYRDKYNAMWWRTKNGWKQPFGNDAPEKLYVDREPYVKSSTPIIHSSEAKKAPTPAHKVEIYPNAVVVDGKPLKVRKDGVTVNNVADGDNLLSVTVELMVEDVTLFPYRYGAK